MIKSAFFSNLTQKDVIPRIVIGIAFIVYLILIFQRIRVLKRPNRKQTLIVNGRKFDSTTHRNAGFVFLVGILFCSGITWMLYDGEFNINHNERAQFPNTTAGQIDWQLHILSDSFDRSSLATQQKLGIQISNLSHQKDSLNQLER